MMRQLTRSNNHDSGLVRHWLLSLWQGCLSLSAILILSTVQVFANPSLRETLPAARAGDARAQYIAGMTYLFGQGTRQDITEAARWLGLSARAGIPQAMVALASLYDVGHGVPFDRDRATQLRQQAARSGNPTARGQLADDIRLPGQRDFRRANVLTDLRLYHEAIPYAKKAATGSANAQLLLGRAYHFGLGSPVDLRAAVSLYQRSAAGGLADGNRALAYMYEFGLGVRVDRQKALFYYDRAAAKGSGKAHQAAANLRSPDYDRPPPQQNSGTDTIDIQDSKCAGMGGRPQSGLCYDRNDIRIDPSTGQPYR
jgi:uncharacterized protein